MTSNQLRRMLSVRTSPVYAHFSETIHGASSIRAYKVQERFLLINEMLVEDMMKPRYASIAANRWISFTLEIIGSLVVLFCALYAVIERERITGGLVGLSISYALQVTNRMAIFVRNSSELENNIVAVERIMEYSRLPQEATWDDPHTSPSNDWPPAGRIQMEHYATRYRPGLDLVLKDITLEAQPKQKVGIVGRTGAGKSSLTMALFRIIEPASGSIWIDGVDISKIGLRDLRSRMTIIPQDPVLFSGTIRLNVDPHSKYNDLDVWSALQQAHLHHYIDSLPHKLDHVTNEGGSNLSVGQKQLLCLARALLRKTRILVLDEATAAVDLETDDLIQTTIRTQFQHCTVLTIAHRLSTVMDHDRIAVVEDGTVKEFDTPTNLLSDQQSILYAMAKEAGLT